MYAVLHAPFSRGAAGAIALASLILATAGCGRAPAEEAQQPAAIGDTAAAGTAAAMPAADTPVVAADTAVRADAAVADTGTAAPARPAGGDGLTVWMAPGRSSRDSLALLRAIRAGRAENRWPVRGPAPRPGAILPDRRIVAYYGNPLSRRMGALGEFEPDDMLRRLDRDVQQWRDADPATPVLPALHLVAVVAQGSAGRDGRWRSRMDSTLIERVYGWAQTRQAVTFLDIQTGWSTIQQELPHFERFLMRPDVHLGIDPEFNMHRSAANVPPGRRIGTLDASEINYAIQTLGEWVDRYNLPPKVLVIHRFTRNMVTNADQIRLDPRVQVVMHMDGWGPPWLKFDSYNHFVVREPVQFPGFKMFYNNDTKAGHPLLTARELVQLVPAPVYIQYQ